MRGMYLQKQHWNAERQEFEASLLRDMLEVASLYQNVTASGLGQLERGEDITDRLKKREVSFQPGTYLVLELSNWNRCLLKVLEEIGYERVI